MPQRRFASIHVVGTNGKSSVTELAAALLEASGTSTGAYLSPHDERWSQRVLLGGAEIGRPEFAEAVARVAEAMPAAERGLAEGDVVTQFEAATAAAFVAFGAAGVEVAVVEAGLGGRLDATNVVPSRVTALTSIGLEHTEYLGETELEIAAEKLAVLRDHSVLVAGALDPAARMLAERTAGKRHARFVDASAPILSDGLSDRAPYLARNLAVAKAAAEELAGPLSAELVERVAAGVELRGRMELTGADPPVIRDGAHNPDGARALAEALAKLPDDRPVVACIAVLEGKDVEGILHELVPQLDAAVLTEVPPARLEGSGRGDTRSIHAARLADAARAAGLAEVEAVADPEPAVARTIELARDRGGVALLSGSHYLLGYGS
jgi:dihydrofolate synthase / folylpolyglutamate synthase